MGSRQGHVTERDSSPNLRNVDVCITRQHQPTVASPLQPGARGTSSTNYPVPLPPASTSACQTPKSLANDTLWGSTALTVITATHTDVA